MGDFIAPEELASFLQQDLDRSSAELAIAIAEDLIRVYTGQHISYVEDDAVLFYPNYGDEFIRLPHRPASAPTLVKVNGVTTTYWRYRNRGGWGRVYRTVGTQDMNWWSAAYGVEPEIEITYSHGYEEIPPLIKGYALEIAGRFYSDPGSVRSETTGPYSVTRDQAAAYLTKSEKWGLARFSGNGMVGVARMAAP